MDYFDYRHNWKSASVSDLMGLTLASIGRDEDSRFIVFNTTCGREFRMVHLQDCCEDVRLEDIVGDLADLIDSPITLAEESIATGDSDYGSFTATFYKFATVKGYVDLRWNGESNGYYSESVDFIEKKKENE